MDLVEQSVMVSDIVYVFRRFVVHDCSYAAELSLLIMGAPLGHRQLYAIYDLIIFLILLKIG